jgi:hypothetical protein
VGWLVIRAEEGRRQKVGWLVIQLSKCVSLSGQASERGGEYACENAATSWVLLIPRPIPRGSTTSEMPGVLRQRQRQRPKPEEPPATEFNAAVAVHSGVQGGGCCSGRRGGEWLSTASAPSTRPRWEYDWSTNQITPSARRLVRKR